MLFDPKWQAPVHEVKTAAPWRELLLKAAEEIEMRGLCKSSLSDERGRICVVEAISRAGERLGINMQSQQPAYDKLHAHTGCDDVVRFTNVPERTAAEVIDALRAAARK